MGFRKGQSALDFLMTYGWALALIVVIAAMLFALGVFDVSNFVGSKAAGFAGVSVRGWSLSPTGVFSIKVSNEVGHQIAVNYVNVTVGNTTIDVHGTNPIDLSVGQDSATLTSAAGDFGTPAINSGYTAKVNIGYTDLDTNFPYVSSGTLTGKVA